MAHPVQIRNLWFFRQRVPLDVRQVMGGPREVKRSLGQGTRAEIEARYHAVAAEFQEYWAQIRVGVRRLTPEQCHALAGDIYKELTEKWGQGKGSRDALMTLGFAHGLWKALKECDTDEIDMGRLRGMVPKIEVLDRTHRPRIEALLSKRGIAIDAESYRILLHAVNDACLQAAEVFVRNGRGDYSEDPRANRFPKPETVGLVVNQATLVDNLLKAYYAFRKKDEDKAKKYRHFFDSLAAHVGTEDFSKVTTDDLLAWRDSLSKSGIGQGTIKEGYFAHVKALFKWAKRMRKIPFDPSADVYLEVNDAQDMRALTDDEANLILSASLATFSRLTSPKKAAARRWVPWLCAYTGARINEITQLRAMDVVKVGELWCIRIVEEAGSVKNKFSERTVPLHPHLIEQGFVEFAQAKAGEEPLFYSASESKKKGYKTVGTKLAEWVRGLGVDGEDVAPFHGWRHRFATMGRDCGMDLVVLSHIQGHAAKTENEKYGKFPPKRMHAEIVKHPRYEVVAAATVDRRRREVKARMEAEGAEV